MDWEKSQGWLCGKTKVVLVKQFCISKEGFDAFLFFSNKKPIIFLTLRIFVTDWLLHHGLSLLLILLTRHVMADLTHFIWIWYSLRQGLRVSCGGRWRGTPSRTRAAFWADSARARACSRSRVTAQGLRCLLINNANHKNERDKLSWRDWTGARLLWWWWACPLLWSCFFSTSSARSLAGTRPTLPRCNDERTVVYTFVSPNQQDKYILQRLKLYIFCNSVFFKLNCCWRKYTIPPKLVHSFFGGAYLICNIIGSFGVHYLRSSSFHFHAGAMQYSRNNYHFSRRGAIYLSRVISLSAW